MAIIKPKTVDEIVLDPFEQEIEDGPDWVPLSPDESARIDRILRASREAREREKYEYQISLSSFDNSQLQTEASVAGVPSQMFLADIVHKYFAGQLTAAQG